MWNGVFKVKPLPSYPIIKQQQNRHRFTIVEVIVLYTKKSDFTRRILNLLHFESD